MKIEIAGKSYRFDVVNLCPHCHEINVLEVVSIGKSPKLNECGVVMYCEFCQRLSFANLVLIGEEFGGPSTKLRAIHPNPQELPIPAEIRVHFPKFYEIYRQAADAELHKLMELSGMGYRKALENLVKNYLVEMHPDMRAEIMTESLGKSIGRIEYPRMQALAKAASWIGNDETHSVKKNSEWTVEDMKNFMVALCHLIIAEKVGDKALEQIKKR